jgi:hypothetical protein
MLYFQYIADSHFFHLMPESAILMLTFIRMSADRRLATCPSSSVFSF